MPKKKIGGKPVKKKTAAKSDWVPSNWLLLTEITADPEVQARVELDQEAIADYLAAMLKQMEDDEEARGPEDFEPCVVFREGKKFWLADGFHRYDAALRSDGKIDRLLCETHEGGKRAAMLFALGANADHGLRRTKADKHKAVSLMLRDDEWKQWSSYKIAEQCNVSHTFVDNVRNDLEQSTETKAERENEGRKYITRHGTESTMRTGKRRARKKGKKTDNKEGKGFDPVAFVTRGAIRESDLADPDREARPDEGSDRWQGENDEDEVDRDEVEALRRANEQTRAEKRTLESKIAELEAKQADSNMSSNEFQAAIGKWQDTVETQKTIIRDLQKENASLRAAGAAHGETQPQTLAQMFNRAVDALALVDHAISDGPAALWPEKVKSRDRNRSINEVHHFLARLRGFRDVVELYSGEGEPAQ